MLGVGGKDGGQQLGRCRAGELGRRRRAGGSSNGQVGCRHVQPGVGQAGGDADQPRVAGGSAAAEHQRSAACGGYLLGDTDAGWTVMGRHLIRMC